MSEKPLVWLGSARRDIRAFPAVKRARKTPPHELKVAHDRYRALLSQKRVDDAKKT